jgi:uncharacterized membrane protein YfcA
VPPLPFHPAWIVVCFAVTLIGVTKSGFGAGVGLIIVPITALGLAHLPLGEQAALGLLLPLLLTGDLIAITQYRKLLDTTLLRRLALPTLVGVVVGAGLLWLIHYIGGKSESLAQALIRMEIGLECVTLVSLHYYGFLRGLERKLLPEPLRSVLSGGYCGVSSTLAHAAGPVIALYLLPLRLPREKFVGTCAVYFGALNAAKLPAYYAAGQFSQASVTLSLRFLPLVFVGALLGRWMVKRINDKLFGHIVYSSTFLMGLYLLTDATIRFFALRQ